MELEARTVELILPIESWALKGVPWTEIRSRIAERTPVECALIREYYQRHRLLSPPDEEAVNLLVGKGYSTVRVMDLLEPSLRASFKRAGQSFNEEQIAYMAESLALYVEGHVRDYQQAHSKRA